MVDYEYGNFFMQDSIEKQVTITYGSTSITNNDLFNQIMTLEESLCSDGQLTFGSCEASVLKFQVANIVAPVKNQWLTVKMALEGNTDKPFAIGKYKVESDKPTADRKWREIVAYDALYDVINADVKGWYNKAFPGDGSTMTIRQLRSSFLGHFGIKEAEISLINDDMVVGKTWKSEELSGKTVINAICEINGCFGHIGRDGLFHYIYLAQGIQGLYPKNDIYPADDLYPRDPKSNPIPKNLYISCTYEDFTTGDIGKLQIINGDSGTASVVGKGDNCYNIESNFLVAGKTKAELDRIGERILSKIRGVTYQPFDVECMGNPCFEVGDPVRLSTTYDIVETYILKRTLTGIQALRDSYSSDGVEKYELKVNSTKRAVEQLNNKTDSLEEDVGSINEDIGTIGGDIDEINGEIEDINENVGGLNISLQKTEAGLQAEVSRAKTAEGDLSSRITMTESEITAEVTRAKGEEESLSSRISLTDSSITAEVIRAKNAENVLSGRITLTAEQFQTDLTDTAKGLQSQITQTASSIKSEVSQTYETKGNANSNYSELSSRITQTASDISLKVSKGDVISEINMSSDTIYLGAGQLVISSGNLKLDSYGKADFSGNLSSPTGTIGGFTIGNGYLSNGSTQIAQNAISSPTISGGSVNANSIYGQQSELPIGASGKVRIYSGNCDISCDANSGISITSRGGEMILYAKEHNRIRTESGGYWVGVVLDSNSSGKSHLRPENAGIIDCGSTSYHWDNVYANNGTIQTSDRKEKTNIADMTESYAEQMIDGAMPKTYQMINGSSGRTHNGLIAQDVEAQLYGMGLTTKDFAGLVMYEKEVEGIRTGETGYGLRYEEYIPILIKYVQGLKRYVREAETRASNMQNMLLILQSEVMILKQQLGGNL